MKKQMLHLIYPFNCFQNLQKLEIVIRINRSCNLIRINRSWKLLFLSILLEFRLDFTKFLAQSKVHIFWEGHNFLRNIHRRFVLCKGQLILKCLFGVFNFFQKTDKNTSHSSENEFTRSFFGRIHGLIICFWN